MPVRRPHHAIPVVGNVVETFIATSAAAAVAAARAAGRARPPFRLRASCNQGDESIDMTCGSL